MMHVDSCTHVNNVITMSIVCVAPVAMQPTTDLLPPPVVPTSGAAAPILPSGTAAPILPSGTAAPILPSGTAAPILPSGEACLDHVTE